MIGTRWTKNFNITDDELDLLVNTLLEQETPMTTRELARLIVEARLQAEQDALAERFKDTTLYRPAQKYEVGARLVFTEMELATATVVNVRGGNNDAHGEFDVIAVKFDDDNITPLNPVNLPQASAVNTPSMTQSRIAHLPPIPALMLTNSWRQTTIIFCA